jgi:hypothetical protein
MSRKRAWNITFLQSIISLARLRNFHEMAPVMLRRLPSTFRDWPLDEAAQDARADCADPRKRLRGQGS